MILYIAEKPSLGRALADVLPKPHDKGDGFIRLANGDVVSWCIGHLLEQAEPDAYNAEFKQWLFAHLPIVPEQWQLQVKPKTRRQFTVLKKLIQQADVLVNVGDPDREGQILVDEVIHYCGVSSDKFSRVQRCLISDLNPSAVKKSLQQLRSNSDFSALATSALARARADWLYGINMTRACTLQGQKSGYQGVLSVGRVQTPLLGLVVTRDLEIEQFVSKPFYTVEASLQTEQQEVFTAKWQPSEACLPFMDQDKRVLSKKLADNVAGRIVQQPGCVESVTEKVKKQPPPLPYNLSTLQIDAAKRFAMNAKRVLDTCQQLYERHKLITYPRSDCRYLPNEHFYSAPAIVKVISGIDSDFSSLLAKLDTNRRSKAWNDSKVSAHHAIIPTHKTIDATKLSADERHIYHLIARQYLIQFLPSFDVSDTRVEISLQGGLFLAQYRHVFSQGWKIAFPSSHKESEQQQLPAALPALVKGQIVTCFAAQVIEKNTTPPKRFDDASLLAAMTGIARFVSDASIRKVLRDTDGLGTEATRASIIELLFQRGFLQRKGKEIYATEVGRQLIQALPEKVSRPDMTAQWESQLEAICQRQLKYQQFMQPMVETLQQLVNDVERVQFSGLSGKGKSVKKAYRRRKKNHTQRVSNYTKRAPK